MRLSILEDYLNTILQAVQDSAELLFDGRDFIQAKPGHVETTDISAGCGHLVRVLGSNYTALVRMGDEERLHSWMRLHLELRARGCHASRGARRGDTRVGVDSLPKNSFQV